MRELRRENQLLRQQLDVERGQQVHQPYLALEDSRRTKPKRPTSETDSALPTTPTSAPRTDAQDDVDMSPSGGPPDLKRIRAPAAIQSVTHGSL